MTRASSPPPPPAQNDGPGRWPKLVVFLARHAALGAFFGAVLAVVLISLNTNGLLDLLRNSPDPVTPVILFVAGFASLLGSVFAGAAVMLLPYDG